jgi:hypothetical protein
MSHPLNYYLERIFLHASLILFLSGIAMTLVHRFLPFPAGKRRAVLLVGSIGLLVLYISFAFVYLCTVPFSDHTEPLISTVAWNYVLGGQMFHGPSSAARYSNPYGPVSYLAEAASLWIFGPGPFSAKLPFVFAGLAACGIMAFLLQRKVGFPDSLYLTAVLIMVLFGFSFISFWTRPDPFVFLMVVLSIWAIESPHRLFSVSLLGLALGIAVLAKAYAPIFFLLPLLRLSRRLGIMRLIQCLLVSVIPPLVIFFVLPRISLANHLHWLLLTSHEGLQPGLLRLNGEYFVLYFCWPLATLISVARHRTCAMQMDWAMLLLSGFLTTVFASKTGADVGYFIPVTPLLIWIGIDLHAFYQRLILQGEVTGKSKTVSALTLKAQLGAFLILAVTGVIEMGYFFVTTRHEGAVRQDLIALLQQYPQKKIGMGVQGYDSPPGKYRWSFYSDAVYRGSPLQLQTVAICDMTITHTPFPRATFGLLANKYYNIWIFPASSQPFSDFPYPPTFHDAFMANYRFKSTDGIYDVWVTR